MKVLFLDFDGVLNSEKYVRGCGHFGAVIDPSRMVLLKQIVDATGARLVLSTSWREHWGRTDAECDDTGRQINAIFADHGLTVWDKTPQLRLSREEEIKAWLDVHPEVTAFAVLDDRVLSADFLDGHFVKTANYRDGLDEAAAAKAIALLRGRML